MAKVQFKKKINVMAVVGKLFGTLLGLWVGGTLMTNLGSVMMCTSSPFYSGLRLIGWTITDGYVPATAGGTCNATTYIITGSSTTYNSIITSTTASTGILGIIGLVGIASIVLEFVYFKL